MLNPTQDVGLKVIFRAGAKNMIEILKRRLFKKKASYSFFVPCGVGDGSSLMVSHSKKFFLHRESNLLFRTSS